MTPKQLRQCLLWIVLTMLSVGIVSVYSSSAMISHATYGHSLRFIQQHLLAVGIGLLATLGALLLPFDTLRRGAKWLFGLSVVLLILVLVLGPEVGGAQRWFRIGRWSFQPSELAQLALVLYLADVLARKADDLEDVWRGLLPPLAATGLLGTLVLLQPDFGAAMVMGSVAFVLLIVAKARWQHLLILALVAGVGAFVLIMGADYRRHRLLAFLHPDQDPRGSGYQILQSYVALASGGFFGVGIGASMQKLFFLPGAHNDFVFAIIGEELGLLGSTAILTLFALFLLCGFRLAMRCQDAFGKYLICGFVAMIGLKGIVNIAVVIGLLPTKGLPLPLISYGGTAIIMNLLACAVIFQASRYGERYVPECAVSY